MLIALIKIIRPLNFFISFTAIFSGGLICGASGNYTTLSLAGIAGALVGAAGNIINDYFDIEIDKVNRPERVLPGGLISTKTALYFYIFVSALALSIAALLSTQLFLIAFSAEAVILLYCFKLKAVPLAGNFAVSFVTGFALIFGAASVGDPAGGIIPAVFAFMVNFVREIVKDIEDIEGDAGAGVLTFPAKFGIPAAKRLIAVLTILLMIATTIPYFTEIYSIEYFVVVMTVVNVLFVYFLRELFKPSFENNIRRISSLLKLNMLFGILAILAGNLL